MLLAEVIAPAPSQALGRDCSARFLSAGQRVVKSRGWAKVLTRDARDPYGVSVALVGATLTRNFGADARIAVTTVTVLVRIYSVARSDEQ